MRRMSTNGGADDLAPLPWLRGLDRRRLDAVRRAGSRAEVAAGQVVMAEGTPGRQALLVLDGTARVTVGGRVVARVGSGEFLGELALVEPGLRTATVVAETAMTVLAFGPGEFAHLLREPVVHREVTRELARRLRRSLADATG